MLPLLRKDGLFLAKPYIVLTAIFVVIFFGVISSANLDFFLYYGSVLITFMLMHSILHNEIKHKTDALLNSLPITRTDIPLTHYIEGFLLSLIGFGFMWLSISVFWFFTDFSFPHVGMHFSVAIGLDLLLYAVFLPFYYRFQFGFVLMTSYFVYIPVLVLTAVLDLTNDILEQSSLGATVGILMAAVISLYIFSFFVSMAIYRKKEI